MKVETSSGSADILPKNSDDQAMCDGELAASLLDEVIGVRGVREPVKSMLERAYNDLVKRNNEWTRRRVRAVFHKEANRIDHREIREMRDVIEARKRHAAYREETTAFAAMAVVRAQARHSGVASGQGSGLGGMDMPRTEG
jgi:hypothetical protein